MKAIKTITKHNWFLRLIKKIIRTVRKTPELVLHDDKLPEKAIYYANHSGAAGPLTLSVFFSQILGAMGSLSHDGSLLFAMEVFVLYFLSPKIGI